MGDCVHRSRECLCPRGVHIRSGTWLDKYVAFPELHSLRRLIQVLSSLHCECMSLSFITHLNLSVLGLERI